MGVLRAVLEAAVRGEGGLVLLHGPAGSGKTRLLELLARWAAEARMPVYRGAAWDSSDAPPLWPWREVVRDATMGREPSELVGHRAPALLALAGLGLADGDPLTPRDVLAARLDRFTAVVALLRALAAGGALLVVLDDLHAADEQTVELARFAARRLRGSPVLLAAAVRDALDGAEPALEAATMLNLRGLDTAAVEELAEWWDMPSLPADTIAMVHTATGGNPLHVTQSLAVLAGDPVAASDPDSARGLIRDQLRDLVQERLRRLSGDVQELLAAASVVGRDVTLPVVARMLDRPLSDTARSLVAATTAGLLVATGVGRYRFGHELIREAVYASLDPDRAAGLHGAAGRVLERLHGTGRDDVLAAVAHHYLHAAPADGASARRAASAAADRAVAAMAYPQAVVGYGAALDASAFDESAGAADRADLLLRRAQARCLAGEPGAARADFLAAAAAAREAADVERLGAAALGMGAGGYLPNIDAERLALIGEALARKSVVGPALRAQLLVAGSQELLTDVASLPRRRAMAEEAADLAAAQPDPAVRAEVFPQAAVSLIGPDTLARRVALLDDAVLAAVEARRPDLEFQARIWSFGASLERGEFGPARAQLMVLAGLAERLRRPQYSMYVAARHATVALLAGRLDDVLARTDEARRLAQDAGEPAGLMVAADLTAQVALLRGAPELARSAEVAFREVRRRSADLPTFRVRHAHLRALLGDPAPAAAVLARLLATELVDLRTELNGLPALARVTDLAWYLRDRGAAAALYTELAPWADLHVVDGSGFSYSGPVTLHLGRMAALAGDLVTAATHLDAAAAVAAREDLPLVAAQVAAAAGCLRGRRGIPDAAARRARELAQRLGAGSVLRDLDEFETVPAGPVPALGVFRRAGNLWEVGIDPERVWVHHRHGMTHLARLLDVPHTEVHALDMLSTTRATPAAPAERMPEGMAGRRAPGFAALDEAAKVSYRRRVAELRDELHEAEDCHDPVRAERAQAELDAVAGELAAATGLSGRDRWLGDAGERARVSVTRTIRAAIKAISDIAPVTGQHLSTSVRTGIFCAYRPEHRAAVRWRL